MRHALAAQGSSSSQGPAAEASGAAIVTERAAAIAMRMNQQQDVIGFP